MAAPQNRHVHFDDETYRVYGRNISVNDPDKPQVILIAYYFPPTQAVGSLRPFRFYKYLKRMGFRCHVITASKPEQNYAADVNFIPDELRDVWDGAAKRPLSLNAYSELLVRKVMFPGQLGIIWSIKAASLCHKIVAEHLGDRFVLFSTYPPLGVLLTGLIVMLRKRIPWISDFRDPLGIGLGEGYVSGWMQFWNRRLETAVFRVASSVIANVEDAANLWRRRYPWARSKLHVIYNGFDPEEAPRAREIPPRTRKLIVHAGSLYCGRTPRVLVESLARLRAKGVPEAFTASILLVGSFDTKVGLAETLYQQAQRDGWLELRGRFQGRIQFASSKKPMDCCWSNRRPIFRFPAKFSSIFVLVGRFWQ
jgi:hypothetical protein